MPLFLTLSECEEIPEGFRLATVDDVTKFQAQARDAITEEKAPLNLEDGKISGPCYGYEVQSGSFCGLAFKLAAMSTLGWYVIESTHCNLVLDIDCGMKGQKLIVWPRHLGDNQLWKWKGNLLVSKTRFVADVSGANKCPGANAISWTQHGGLNQQWEQDGDAIVSCLNGLILTIKDGSKSQGTETILENRKGCGNPADHQKWVFRSAAECVQD